MSPRAFGTEVGTIGGHFSATPGGQASYTMPLPAPGGAGGLAPQLSIVYASGSGRGLLGRSVTIGGLSFIKRCASDRDPIGLDQNDTFCLDGQNIWDLPSSAHLKVLRQGANDGDGPAWFKVLHPDGSVWEYGRNGSKVTIQNSDVGLVWALDKIIDASGNTMEFHYQKPPASNALRIRKVDWGAGHSFVFQYEPVSDDAVSYSYIAGILVTRDWRLHKVVSQYNGSLVLSWTAGYLPDGNDADDSNRTRLVSLQECDANGHCFSPTTFQWQHGTAGFATPQDTAQAGSDSTAVFSADVDGDGRDDLVYARAGEWWVRFAGPNDAFGSAHAMGVGPSSRPEWAQPIHFSAGAAEQILYVNATGDWAILGWNGSGFGSTDTGVAAGAAAVALDVNGDGYDDLVTRDYHNVYVWLNRQKKSGQGRTFDSAQVAYSVYGQHWYVVGFRDMGQIHARGIGRTQDFKRDAAGLIVIVRYQSETICIKPGWCPPDPSPSLTVMYYDRALIWRGGQFEVYGQVGERVGEFGQAGEGRVLMLDVNGDGLSDVFNMNAGTVYMNTGAGFNAVAYGSSLAGLDPSGAVVVDYNGDGRDDLLVPESGGDLMLLASTGTNLAAPTSAQISAAHFTHPVLLDTVGCGLYTLVGAAGPGDIYVAARIGPCPDLLTKVADGLGNYVKLAWTARTDAAVIGTTLNVPDGYVLDFHGKPLLKWVKRNDGIGGQYKVTRHYDTPLAEVGDGFTGFMLTRTTDSRNQHSTTRTYKAIVDFNRHGVLQSRGLKLDTVTLAQSNDNPIRKKVYTYTSEGSIQKHIVATTSYAPSRQKLSVVTKTFGYDDQNEPSSIETQVTELPNGAAHTWTTTKMRERVSGDGCFGLTSSVTVTKTLPSGVSKTRKTALAACRT